MNVKLAEAKKIITMLKTLPKAGFFYDLIFSNNLQSIFQKIID